jgi:hypothetical protein
MLEKYGVHGGDVKTTAISEIYKNVCRSEGQINQPLTVIFDQVTMKDN